MKNHYSISGITSNGMTWGTSVNGTFVDAQRVLRARVERGLVPGQTWDRPLTVATIACDGETVAIYMQGDLKVHTDFSKLAK